MDAYLAPLWPTRSKRFTQRRTDAVLRTDCIAALPLATSLQPISLHVTNGLNTSIHTWHTSVDNALRAIISITECAIEPQ